MKKSHLINGIALLTVSAAVFISCRKEIAQDPGPATLNEEPNLPSKPYDYAEKHLVNSDLATLGRVLFYDKNLSANNAVSCGSCHKQEFAFADNVQFNKGFNGMNLTRNSPSIQGIRGFTNTAQFVFQNGQWVNSVRGMVPTKENQSQVLLFWDGRQNSVADMVLNPVLNHNEMNVSDFETLTKKLSGLSYYHKLFRNAFGDETITKERMAFAMQSFIACLNTPSVEVQEQNQNQNPFNNPNMNQPQQDDSHLSAIEKQGKELFHTKYNCAQCHDPSNTGTYGTVVTPSQMFNIGLDEVYRDQGLGQLTKKQGDNGLFKVPTLKNISLTAPYMHDGRFANLGEVIDHYSHGIRSNNNLSGKFRNLDGSVKKLNILPTEKSALIAFLNTLRDDDFLTSPMYSDPFKK